MTVGVGVGFSQISGRTPRSASTTAAVRANSSAKNRVSCATSSVGFGWLFASTWSATAATAIRTRGNVKSSAIIPRHPEVPNLIAESLILFLPAAYCIVASGRARAALSVRCKE